MTVCVIAVPANRFRDPNGETKETGPLAIERKVARAVTRVPVKSVYHETTSNLI